MWLQRQITLTAKPRSFHLIADEVLSSRLELKKIKTGLTHFTLQHTWASLSLNENADASVRRDLETHFIVVAPESARYYKHIHEDEGDVPAHIKSSLLGSSLSVPICSGEFMLGTWQGLVLGEHRDAAGSHCVIATPYGECNEI